MDRLPHRESEDGPEEKHVFYGQCLECGEETDTYDDPDEVPNKCPHCGEECMNIGDDWI